MTPFTTLTAIAAPLDAVNLDTDQIIPARFLRKPRDHHFRSYLFHDLRYAPDGGERPDFVLNRAPYRPARILVGAANFGCGSSREAAVFALQANDIRAVIAPSFGDIFHGNCFNNGLLPIVLSEQTSADIRRQLRDRPGSSLTIDLSAQTVVDTQGVTHAFAIDAFRKRCLLDGIDEIDLTLTRQAQLDDFEHGYRAEMSWLRYRTSS